MEVSQISVSIDGKIHKANITVKYGEEFPKRYRSKKLENSTYGKVLVYITHLGQPKWTPKMTVSIPFKYYITEIIEPSKEYQNKKRKEKSGLHVVK